MGQTVRSALPALVPIVMCAAISLIIIASVQVQSPNEMFQLVQINVCENANDCTEAQFFQMNANLS